MQKKLKIAGVVIFFITILIITVAASRWVMSLSDASKFEEFQNWVSTLGFGGWLLLLAIQYVQIVIAFIPGGPIQIAAGALYGVWGGLAICVGGTFLATATVFYLVSRFGHSVISLFVEEKDMSKYKFLKDEKNLEKLVLLLFFIPATPKDALTYLFALTSIRMSRFMVLSTLARIPAMLTSILAGDNIVAGNWLRAVMMFVIMTAVAILGFLLQRFLQKRIEAGRETGK